MDWGSPALPPAVPFTSYLYAIRLPYGNVGGVLRCFFKREIKKKIASWLFSQSRCLTWSVAGGAVGRLR